MSNEELAQAKILVIGVGGAGNNAVNRMVDEAIEGVELIGINTDKQALDLCKAPTSVPVSYTHLDVYKRQMLCTAGSEESFKSKKGQKSLCYFNESTKWRNLCSCQPSRV